MKKIKFLSIATMVAFMAMGLSSCEKENFRSEFDVEVDAPVIPDAAPAVVSINPNVLAFINGSAKNVTSEADITYNVPEAGEDGTIAAQEVTINVKYTAEVEVYGEKLTKEVTATETVKVPALGKGMCCVLNPTIVLSVQTNVEAVSPSKGQTTELTPEPKDVTIKNETQYFYTDVNGEYEYKSGTEVENINWIEDSFKYDNEINATINEFNKIEMKKQPVKDIVVMAQSQTIIKAEILKRSTEYVIKKNISLGRATTDTMELEIVKFNVVEYYGIQDNSNAGAKSDENPNGYDVNIHIQGVGHGHGHGHGSGHGNSSNAGGGLVWGE